MNMTLQHAYNLTENIDICSSIVNDSAQLLFYSHIPTAAAGIFLAYYILFKNKNDLLGRLLAALATLFAAWCTTDLMVWFTFDNSRYLMFAWSLYGIIHILIYITAFHFSYLFITQKKLPLTLSILCYVLLIPIIIFAPSILNLIGYNTVDCIAIEQPFYLIYHYYGGLLLALLIVVVFLTNIRKINSLDIKKTVLFVLGIETFLLVFFGTELGIGYLIDSGLVEYGNYNLEQYGLFSMPLFIGLLSYLTVKYKLFNIKLIATQALVAGLVFIIAAEFFFVKTVINYVLVALTLLLSSAGGYFLVKSVKKEIKLREEVELLAYSLEKANTRLKELDKQKSEFVSIASHQLRSPLTAMRGYASMLSEGSFGKIPDKALEAAKRIEESAKLMAMSVEDYLNVSRIESGNMKYNLSDFNVKDMVEKICEDLRPEAMKLNLILLFRTDLKSRAIVNADVGKTNQIIHNLINNSIKYTPKGSVSVFVRDDIKKKRIYIDITDTGIGMSQETMHTLFQKFSRADNANSVNVSGTGLGLYVAAKMAEAMGGGITCTSAGDGKGSTFTIELPLAM